MDMAARSSGMEDTRGMRVYTSAFVGSIQYYVKEPAEVVIDSSESSVEPAVVVNLPADCADALDYLDTKFADFSTDDVFNVDFATLGTVIFVHQSSLGSKLPNPGQCFTTPRGQKCQRAVAVDGKNFKRQLQDGPYFLKDGGVHQAWRLYADSLSAFVTPTIPSGLGPYEFEPLRVTAYDGSDLALAVPSRLYYPSDPRKPLNGKRLSLKDNIHLSGVKTTNGNRAYADCYSAQSVTADYVRILIDQGAVIVGKTKMNAFAGSEKPPDQAIDYFPPWNPRGDFYQKPAGSSSGAGVCIAGYDWMDMAIGTDTTGSIREPARAVGTWGLKVTNRILSNKGLDPSSVDIDSYGLLTRGGEELRSLTAASLTGLSIHKKFPKKIIYPTDWLPYKNDYQQKLNEEFLSCLEAVLKVKRTEVSLTSLWTETAPKELRNVPIAAYLKNSGFWPLYYDNYHNSDQFREDYRRKFGKEAYVSPPQRWKWDLGAKVTQQERAQGIAEIEVYKKWVAEQVLTIDSDGDGEAVIFLPLGNAAPDWRDVPNKPPSVVQSFEPKYFASVLGLPQIVLPIAQIPYESHITKRKEYTPVITTFAGAKGSDLVLIEVAKAAIEHGRYPNKVQTGRFMFEPAENSRHTASGDQRSVKLC